MSVSLSPVAALRAAERRAVRVAVLSCEAHVRYLAAVLLAHGHLTPEALELLVPRVERLRVSYSKFRAWGVPASRLAVLARYGTFLAACARGDKSVPFPGLRGSHVARDVIAEMFAEKAILKARYSAA